MTNITFELGKFYKTRDGRKAQIFMLDNGKGLMFGAVYECNQWLSRIWKESGKTTSGDEDRDLVSEWREPIKYSVELWGNEFKPGPETTLTIRMFGEFPRWNSAEKTEQCPIKYRVTVEELPDDAH